MERDEFLSLIDQLGKKAQECKELLSDMRSMDKALRQTVKDVRHELAKQANERVEEAMAPLMQRAVDDAIKGWEDVEAKGFREINKLLNAFLAGTKADRETLPDLLKRKGYG